MSFLSVEISCGSSYEHTIVTTVESATSSNLLTKSAGFQPFGLCIRRADIGHAPWLFDHSKTSASDDTPSALMKQFLVRQSSVSADHY